MLLFTSCQAESVHLALTSGAPNNSENMTAARFNSTGCVCVRADGFWQVSALLAGVHVPGSSVGAGPFHCSPPGQQDQRMKAGTCFGDKLM